jgi:hypothetical protein
LDGAALSLLRIFVYMNRMIRFCLSAFFVVLLMAADTSWKSKTISQWSAEDAGHVLTNSAWVKRTTVAILPQRSEAQLREGGKMGGGGQRAGLGSLSESSRGETLDVRWESAAPVRAAELKAGETGAPDWEGDYYAIAVYDVPGISPVVQKSLSGELKQTTFLKRNGKKDLKPVRIDIVLMGKNRARVVYFFSRSAEITLDDQRVEFVAQIGRLYVTQFFDTGEMQFQGKLEL